MEECCEVAIASLKIYLNMDKIDDDDEPTQGSYLCAHSRDSSDSPPSLKNIIPLCIYLLQTDY